MQTVIIPATKPQISREEVLELLKNAHPDFTIPNLLFIGIRGYYQDSMGKPGKNDRNIYDDAIIIMGKDEFLTFNGNTDPSAFKKAIASLKPGIWPVYKFDLHKGQYLALCQRGGAVTVIRDETGADTGNFGINIHRGGNWGTGSLGCQTIPREDNQFDDFINTAVDLAKKYFGKDYRKLNYTYVLLENQAKAKKPAEVNAEKPADDKDPSD